MVTFALLGYVNIRLHRHHLEAATLAAAERVSDTIKRTTSYHMLRNDREALYEIIRTIGGRARDRAGANFQPRRTDQLFQRPQRNQTSRSICAPKPAMAATPGAAAGAPEPARPFSHLSRRQGARPGHHHSH